MGKTWRIHNMDMVVPLRIDRFPVTGAASRKRTWPCRFRHFVEYTPWDETLIRQDRWINPLCWAAVGLATLYFLPVCLGIFRF